MTATDLLLSAILRAELAGTALIQFVLIVRGPARRLIGAQLAYRLWLLPPMAAVAALFPSLAEFLPVPTAGPAAPSGWASAALLVWLAGAAAAGALIAWSERRFRRLVGAGRAGPAVVGVLWPRMVTPSDFAARFTPEERAVIRRHERTHIVRGDPFANLVLAIVQALSWFNPLVHWAAARVRLDQELACDAAVVERAPSIRRLYGATLVKAQLRAAPSPLVCAWPAAGRHPLETRLDMLARRPLTLPQYLRGAAAVGLAALVAAAWVWGTTPRWGEGPQIQLPAVLAR